MKKLPLLMSVLLGLSSSAFADWTLLNDESSLHYVSIKSTNIAEMNRFKTLAGSVSEQGAVELKVDLSSVDTGVDIRDERMQAMLFDVAQFAQATVTGTVDLEQVTKLEVGQTYTDSITLNLALHGLSKEVSSQVQVTRLADDKVLITTLEPVVLNAADYKLAEGLEALRVIAQLPAISPVVPVTYSLVFQQ